MSLPLLSVRIQYEHDVVAARQRTRELAEALGFDTQQQTRLATAVSEIARNAFSYAGSGKVEFSLDGNTAPQLLSIRVVDNGPGIRKLDEIQAGTYHSKTGMGLGIIGSQRLVDRFFIESSPGKGTTVVLGKLLPRRAPLITAPSLPAVLDRIGQQKPKTVLEEFREQNQELLRTMEELRRRQEDLTALNRELEDTNRGVVALYAELDEKANHLRRADEMKSRFLSNMSHEFRTPLNSIQALSRLLLDRTDGDLTSEQAVQVSYIRKSAESLSELVNDLLDIAKVEAGKIEVRPTEFETTNLFGALRGMLKPLLVGNSLKLVFEDPLQVPPVFSDEAKVSQILRNFISNALKFTDAGEVRVAAEYIEAEDVVKFEVSDTGIGIAPEHREHVFQEFTQLDSRLQRKVKGTGLGLPLSRKLAQLLGGDVGLQSEVGVGSTFWLRIPRLFARDEQLAASPIAPIVVTPDTDFVLLVEDHYETRLAYEKYLRGSRWTTVSARSVRETQAALVQLTPVAIVLDIGLQGEDTWDLLVKLKSDASTRDIPIIVVTSLDDRSKSLALGADEFLLKPVIKEDLLAILQRVARRKQRTVLLVDDEEASRYLAKQLFGGLNVRFAEAQDGNEALHALRTDRPDLVIMDLAMPRMNGFQTIEAIQGDPHLKDIPVVISTSGVLPPAEIEYLSSRAIAIIFKSKLLEPETDERLGSALAAAGLADLNAGRQLSARTT